jgi:nicotinate phosphoribosyltransferase
MRDGERLAGSPDLAAAREHAAKELLTLPESMHDPLAGYAYPVEISDTLKALAAKIDRSAQRGAPAA